MIQVKRNDMTAPLRKTFDSVLAAIEWLEAAHVAAHCEFGAGHAEAWWTRVDGVEFHIFPA